MAIALAALLGAAVGATTVSAQDLPSCDGGSTASQCRLPLWPESQLRDAPGLFGTIDAASGSWIDDEIGEVAPGALDITAVGVGSVTIDDAAAIRDSTDLLRLGKPAKAVKGGDGVLLRIVLDRPIDQIEDGHTGVHIATDIDGSRTNNAPTGVGKARGPFAGSQDVYSLTYATTTDKVKLLDSDLSKGWYKDKSPFAASWVAPNVLDVLVRPQALGEGIRIVTFASGPEGGYDSITLGPSAIPVDGRVGLLPACTEAAISTDAFTIGRLVENGQTLRNIEAPASWQGGAAIPIDAESRAAIEKLINAEDTDADGRIGLPATVSLFEDGLVIRQRPEVELALDGDTAQLAVELGLTRRGFNVVRSIKLEPTGNEVADAYLERATRALLDATPPFRSGKRAGPIAGDGIGTCVTALIATPPVVEPEPPADDQDAASA
jgi:hypothetical protein